MRIICFLFLFLLVSPVYAGAVDIRANKGHGPLQTLSGVGVGSSISGDVAADAIRFLGAGGLVQFNSPNTSIVSNPAFVQIVSAGLIPYVAFENATAAKSFASAYFAAYPEKKLFIDLYSTDANAIKSIASQFPQAQVHGGGIWFIDRRAMRGLNTSGVWPSMKALSMRLKYEGGNLFKEANLMLDTLFDAQKDIDGGTGIKLNFPSGAKLAVPEISAGNDAQGKAFRHAVGAAMLATSVQGGPGPLRYVIVSNFDSMSKADREVVARMLKIANTHPTMAWPDAFSGNGDPYDNTFSDQWNTDPVMGIALNSGGGKVFFVVNTSGKSVNVNLQGASGSYKFISSTGAKGTLGSASTTLEPYETKFAAPTIDEGTVVPTAPPLQPTNTIAPMIPTPTRIPTIQTFPTPIPTAIPTPLSGVTVTQSATTLPNVFSTTPGVVHPVESKKIDVAMLATQTDSALQMPLSWIDLLIACDRLLQLRIFGMYQNIEQFVQQKIQ